MSCVPMQRDLKVASILSAAIERTFDVATYFRVSGPIDWITMVTEFSTGVTGYVVMQLAFESFESFEERYFG